MFFNPFLKLRKTGKTSNITIIRAPNRFTKQHRLKVANGHLKKKSTVKFHNADLSSVIFEKTFDRLRYP